MTNKVFYLGPAGSWSHFMANEYASELNLQGKNDFTTYPCKDVGEIINSLQNTAGNYGILALENNVEGFVNEVLDNINSNTDLVINDLKWKQVKFDAVYKKESDLLLKNLQNTERKPEIFVRAHPHALAQCRNFISVNNLIPLPSSSNSQAAIDLKPNELALLPQISHNNFPELINYKESVQDYNNASTAFALVSIQPPARDEVETVSQNHTFWQIIPEKEDKPGTLLNILNAINDNGINISSLNSRPLKGKQRFYSFYIILEADYLRAMKSLNVLSRDDYSIRYLGGWNE